MFLSLAMNLSKEKVTKKSLVVKDVTTTTKKVTKKSLVVKDVTTTTNSIFCNIRFSSIKKMPVIYIFSIIIIDFYFKFIYKVI